MKQSLTYSEANKGWTCFLPYFPDWMLRLNNRFFSIKDGNLYEHNDASNPIKNTFFGVAYPSKITTIFSEQANNDKIFKNIIQEGNLPWKTTVKTNLATSTIEKTEFNRRESRWFAHTRKNEDTADNYTGNMVQGIGVISSFVDLTVTFPYVSDLISVGDFLCQLNTENEEIIGTITAINGNVITVNAITTTPVVGFYCYAKKNSRIEGAEIRGYFLEVELENDSTENVELFAIGTNAVISGMHDVRS